MGIRRRLAESLFGVPKDTFDIKKTGTLVLGQIEQNYGVYVIPSFQEQVNVFIKDPVVREGVQNFVEQVIGTGFYLTDNTEYTFKLGGKTALDVIKEWCEANNIEEKLSDIGIDLKAFGNSFWRITDMGFNRIPIESVWHAVRVDPKIPLQEKYHLQLTPIYGGVVIPWEQFIQFKLYGVGRGFASGTSPPFGIGLMHSLLARPVMQDGTVVPSIYDVRLSMRASLDEGFRKFSFGNVWIGMPNLAEDKLEEYGEKATTMKSTGNRILVNTPVDIRMELPQRTESYDKFIENMRNEFYMSLADPTLKLGLEEGFTKATSQTAAELYKFKIATYRQTIKHHLEDLFVQILDKLGYDGKKANVVINFEKIEAPVYDSKEIFGSVDRGVITRNEARYLLSKYAKWDITGTIEGGDEAIPLPTKGVKAPLSSNTKVKEEGVALMIHESGNRGHVIEVTELPDCLGGYNKKGTIYIDKLAISEGYPRQLLVAHEILEYGLVVKDGIPYEEAHKIATLYEENLAKKLGIDWEEVNKIFLSVLPKIRARATKGPEDLVRN